ncbi:hypothetical protein FHR32_002553 [Streptosporangium album]|uniref:Uncharacterized protein n=1 Tax=Streptosporangium album TaxID=47479 RepID=A0A7W7W8S7_9ACTN|nr:hypothetical protein [Streptosporangium album]MBB4938248.1 hypothetical protein [Streptosporangium album]
MAREPAPVSPQWREWDGGPELSRSWPSPHADIDVNTAGLRKVGDAIMLEADTAYGYNRDDNKSSALGSYQDMTDSDHAGLLGRIGKFDPPRWDALTALRKTLTGISGFVVGGTHCALEIYNNFGNMIFATSANYAMADSVFDKNISVLRYTVNGAGVRHETWKKKSYVWQEDNISDYDAPTIKAMLNSVEVETMLRKGCACADLATWLTSLQSLVEEHARQLAGAWQGEPAELALDAFRKVHATVRALAYAIGTTGDTIIWLANVIHQRQVDFESVVKLGNWEFDDDLPDWLLPWGGGAHDRARDYLRELNQQLKIAYDMLPAEIEVLLPTTRSDNPKYTDEKDGLKDGSDYWDFMILYTPPFPLLDRDEPAS